MQAIRSTLCPACYHGEGQKAPYFEGWYFKMIDASGGQRYAVIPGITLSPGGPGPHSFVQVFDGVRGRAAYHRYPLDAFQAARRRFDVRVGPNRFSIDGIELDIPDGEIPIRGRVQHLGPAPWPVTLSSPGIMGWYAWVPRMECYHGVVSLDHGLAGSLEVEGRTVELDGGRGYIEKDWGKSFPSAWVWMQSNHFAEPGTSLVGSIAMIPWIGRSFRGFIVGLLHRGNLYRFATYTGAVTERLEIDADTVTWTIRDPLYRLALVARRSGTVELRGPSREDMGRRVPETLSAVLYARLTARREGRLIFEGSGRYGGLEVAGDLARLL